MRSSKERFEVLILEKPGRFKPTPLQGRLMDFCTRRCVEVGLSKRENHQYNPRTNYNFVILAGSPKQVRKDIDEFRKYLRPASTTAYISVNTKKQIPILARKVNRYQSIYFSVQTSCKNFETILSESINGIGSSSPQITYANSIADKLGLDLINRKKLLEKAQDPRFRREPGWFWKEVIRKHAETLQELSDESFDFADKES